MFYSYIKKHTDLIYRQILGEDVEEELERIEKELYTRNKPKVLGGTEGVLMQMDQSYETNCSVLQQKGYSNPKKLTVVEFYKAIDLIEKQNSHGKPKRNKANK